MTRTPKGVLVLTVLCLLSLGPGVCTAAADDRVDMALQATADAYRRAPALTDTIVLTVNAGGQAQTQNALIRVQGDDASVTAGEMRFTAQGPHVFIEKDTVSSKYVKLPRQGDLLQTLGRMAQPVRLPVPQIGLRTATSPMERLNAIGMGSPAGWSQRRTRMPRSTVSCTPICHLPLVVTPPWMRGSITTRGFCVESW